MNWLPDVQHAEVIVLSWIIAVTVFTVVSAFVLIAGYLSTRAAAYSRQPADSRDVIPENAAPTEARADTRFPAASAG